MACHITIRRWVNKLLIFWMKHRFWIKNYFIFQRRLLWTLYTLSNVSIFLLLKGKICRGHQNMYLFVRWFNRWSKISFRRANTWGLETTNSDSGINLEKRMDEEQFTCVHSCIVQVEKTFFRLKEVFFFYPINGHSSGHWLFSLLKVINVNYIVHISKNGLGLLWRRFTSRKLLFGF